MKNCHSNFFSVYSELGVTLLVLLILLTGCHSYYTIPKEDYNKISTMEDIKIVYTNGKEFVVEKDETTFVKIGVDSLQVYRGSKETVIPMSEIERIKENRFDLGGTITLPLVILTTITLIFYTMFPLRT